MPNIVLLAFGLAAMLSGPGASAAGVCEPQLGGSCCSGRGAAPGCQRVCGGEETTGTRPATSPGKGLRIVKWRGTREGLAGARQSLRASATRQSVEALSSEPACLRERRHLLACVLRL